jgi:catechol 2,3-dioxygenase-like lactoylglutathione lyase family enzyme
VTLIVDDYDDAIGFFDTLGFELVEDSLAPTTACRSAGSRSMGLARDEAVE